jgi:hypothetical protein
VKEIADRLDIQEYSTKPGNSDRCHLGLGIRTTPRVQLDLPPNLVLNRLD